MIESFGLLVKVEVHHKRERQGQHRERKRCDVFHEQVHREMQENHKGNSKLRALDEDYWQNNFDNYCRHRKDFCHEGVLEVDQQAFYKQVTLNTQKIISGADKILAAIESAKYFLQSADTVN